MTPVAFMRLFPEFHAESWDGWREILGRISPTTRELYVAAGRGSGKSRVCALLACHAAAREYKRAPGERIYVGIFAPDRKQAALTHGYVLGLLRSRPELEALIVRASGAKDSTIELRGDVVVEVVTASVAAPRGRSYALAIIEEAAFLPTDASANPDVELLRAVRPGLARVPGSLLCVVSSPYARRGILWQAAKRAAQGTADDRMIYVQAPTLELNPTFDADAIEAALAEDPTGASAEYLAEFRSDIESFVPVEVVEGCTVPGRHELPPVPKVPYAGFLDFAGGSGQDSATLAIAHGEDRDDQRVGILDLVREVRPPFSPEQVCANFARDLKTYGISTAQADRYAADFAVEAMKRNSITLEPSPKIKSDIYRELLPKLNSGQVELLDHARLAAQLVGLERRVARGGRDSIDHAPGGHDDLANAACGALLGVVAADLDAQRRAWRATWLGIDRRGVTAPSGYSFRINGQEVTAEDYAGAKGW